MILSFHKIIDRVITKFLKYILSLAQVTSTGYKSMNIRWKTDLDFHSSWAKRFLAQFRSFFQKVEGEVKD